MEVSIWAQHNLCFYFRMNKTNAGPHSLLSRPHTAAGKADPEMPSDLPAPKPASVVTCQHTGNVGVQNKHKAVQLFHFCAALQIFSM